jgi:hypothetical protein
MKEIVSMAGNLLTDLQKSPYRTRIIVVLDKIHGKDITESLRKAGIPDENIIIWKKNGIEYYYPESIINGIFGEGAELIINDDSVSRNGISYKKGELCELVVPKISISTHYPEEFSAKFFSTIERVCDLSGVSS